MFYFIRKKASDYVLQKIKSSIENKQGIIGRIATFKEDTGKTLSLSNFVNHYRLDTKAIYKRESFSRMCVEAGVLEDFNEPLEKEITAAFSTAQTLE